MRSRRKKNTNTRIRRRGDINKERKFENKHARMRKRTGPLNGKIMLELTEIKKNASIRR